MTIGFGSTEKQFQSDLEGQLSELIVSYLKDANTYGDDLRNSIDKAVQRLAYSSREQAETYRTSQVYPDRYTSFYIHTLSDASYFVFIVEFMHINRKHALSPDGWGLMMDERCYHFNVDDLKEKAE